MGKEKKSMEERLSDVEATLVEEEEKSKGLMKLKSRHETTIGELEDKLRREEKVSVHGAKEKYASVEDTRGKGEP